MLATSMELFVKGTSLLEPHPDITADDLTAREAMLLVLEGGIYTYKGELERVFTCLHQSLMLCEQLDNPQAIVQSLYYLLLAQTVAEEAVIILNWTSSSKSGEPIATTQTGVPPQ